MNFCAMSQRNLMLIFLAFGVSAMFAVVVSSFGLMNLILLLCILFGILVYTFQSSLIYYPYMPQDSRLNINTPDIFQLDYEEIPIETSEGVLLHSYFIKGYHPAQNPMYQSLDSLNENSLSGLSKSSSSASILDLQEKQAEKWDSTQA
eukprot:Sdes_comp9122_c0_seq1m586